MKKNKDILIFSILILGALIYSSTLHLYKIQAREGSDLLHSVLLHIWNVLFIIQCYLHFYSYLYQLIFTKNVYTLNSVYINKGYMLWYHIAICLFILFYFYIMGGKETLDDLFTILSTGNLILFQFSILFKKSRRPNPLKAEIRVDQFTFKEIASIVLLEFDAKIYYIACDTNIESFKVSKYKVSEDNKYIQLYNNEEEGPQISLNFKDVSKKREEIILFLNEHCTTAE